MRYNQRVTFVKITRSYDPKVGRETEQRIEDTLPASVTDAQMQTSVQLWQKVKNCNYIIRIRQPYRMKIDEIIYNGKRYSVISSRYGYIFYVKEIA